MGKVDELIASWDAVRSKSSPHRTRTRELVHANRADKAAHAAELEAKDRQIEAVQEAHYADMMRIAEIAQAHYADMMRIAEIAQAADDAGWDGVENPKSLAGFVTHQAQRIRELEAELATRKELPPLPDATFPKPVPQWELDAQYLEAKLGGETRSAYLPDEVKAIAARIREAHREAK